MHPMTLNYASRQIGAGVLSALILVLAVACWRWFRHSKRPWLLTSVGCYIMLLMALFMLGLLKDEGYGWAFLPLMIAAAPWSFFAPMVAQGPVGSWFASGLIGNFVLFVVLCGGINSFLLYKLIGRVFYPSAEPVVRSGL